MDRQTAQATHYLAEQVYTWMETNLAAYNVGFEYLPQESPALMLQSEVTDPVMKTYKSGRVIYQYPFSLYLRMDNADNATRINNQRELQAIADELTGATLSLTGFRLRTIEQTGTVRILSTEQGMDVCACSFSIEYERSGSHG